jgi:hypothetical protein
MGEWRYSSTFLNARNRGNDLFGKIILVLDCTRIIFNVKETWFKCLLRLGNIFIAVGSLKKIGVADYIFRISLVSFVLIKAFGKVID